MATQEQMLVGTARLLLASGGALQSTAAGEQIDAATLDQALQAHLSAVCSDSKIVIGAAASSIVQAANAALSKSAAAGTAQITDAELDSLEVIVQALGRPALRYVDGRVQPPTTDAAENERWHVFVATARRHIDAASAAVGKFYLRRSDGVQEHLGTAWRLGADLLVTNRHVVRFVVADASLPPDRWTLDPWRICMVDFAATDRSSTSHEFAVVSLEFCAMESEIDVAVLRLPSNSTGVPPALALDFEDAALGRTVAGESESAQFRGERVYVVGHPLQGKPTSDTQRIFGDADGRKRCSPGEVRSVNANRAAFEHDCSTLRGNSGSAVFSVATHKLVGIHKGGTAGAPDEPGTVNLAVAVSRLGGHELGEILRKGRVPAT